MVNTPRSKFLRPPDRDCQSLANRFLLDPDACQMSTFFLKEFQPRPPVGVLVPYSVREGSCQVSISLEKDHTIAQARLHTIGISIHILGVKCMTSQTPQYFAGRAMTGSVVVFLHGNRTQDGNLDDEWHDPGIGWVNNVAEDQCSMRPNETVVL